MVSDRGKSRGLEGRGLTWMLIYKGLGRFYFPSRATAHTFPSVYSENLKYLNRVMRVVTRTLLRLRYLPTEVEGEQPTQVVVLHWFSHYSVFTRPCVKKLPVGFISMYLHIQDGTHML